MFWYLVESYFKILLIAFDRKREREKEKQRLRERKTDRQRQKEKKAKKAKKKKKKKKERRIKTKVLYTHTAIWIRKQLRKAAVEIKEMLITLKVNKLTKKTLLSPTYLWGRGSVFNFRKKSPRL